MRAFNEIQNAHDILVGIKLGHVHVGLDDGGMDSLTAALDALCWVLEHDHNTTFAKNLDELQQEIEVQGFRLMELPVPILARQFGRDE